VTIQAIVKNEGIATGSYTVNLFIDGKIQDSRDIQIEALSSQTVQFSFVPPLEGTYQVKVNNLTGVFIADPIAGSATASLSDLDISPAVAGLGETVNIRAWIKNTGENKAIYKVDLKINGEVIDSKSVTVPGKGQEEVHFTTMQKVPGTYSVSVGNLSGTFEVKQPATAPLFNLTDLNLSAAQTTPGHPVEISVFITNLGTTGNTFKLELKANKAVVDTQEITLEGKAGQRVVFSYTPEERGEVLIEINNLSTTLAVIASTSLWWLLLLIIGLAAATLTVLIVLKRTIWKGSYGTWAK
jgi:archaellum component FlaG (FlaF/FlaG flagellin family)